MTAVHDTQRVLAQARASDDDDFFAVLLPEAAQMVIVAGHASPAMLSRKMRLGDGLVCDLLAELEDLDVVGPEKADRSRVVLADPGHLDEVLARIADLAGGASEGGDEDDPGIDGVAPPVSLVKPDHHTNAGDDAGASHDEDDWYDDEPGGELVLRPDDDLMPYQRLHLVPAGRQVQTLVVRARQATARATVLVVDQPAVAKGLAITRQAPRAGGRLLIWTPRGASRAAAMVASWVTDSRSSALLEKHAEAGEGEAYARVADARLKANLAGRRATVATVASVVVLLGLAWWAPTVFAGALASLAFAAGLALAVRHTGRELLWGLALAVGLAWVAWWQGPALAALVPQPPAWFWWLAGTALVVWFGLLGRKEDQKLVEMPATMSAHKAPTITAPMVIGALCALGNSKMKEPDDVRVIMDPHSAGEGVQIDLELPPGVTAAFVMDKREQFAAALRHPLGCVWPSVGARHPGHLSLYISKQVMAEAQQEVWPLLAGPQVDIFGTLPAFTDQIGGWIGVSLAYASGIIGAAPRMGKTFLLRQLLLMAGLDPRVKVIALDGKGTGDLSPIALFAYRYVRGVRPNNPENIEKVRDIVRWLLDEIGRRADIIDGLPLEECPESKVTSELIDAHPELDLGPIVVGIDETQSFFSYGSKSNKEHREIREEIRDGFVELMKLGPALGIWVYLATQIVRESTVPTEAAAVAVIRYALKLEGGWEPNDRILGTGMFSKGIDANMFDFADKGIGILKAEGQRAVTCRSVFGLDAVAARAVAARGRSLRQSRQLLVGDAAGDDGIVDAEIVIDIVEDVEHALRSRDRGRAQHVEVAEWLRELRPENYADLDVEELSARLRAAGVPIRQVRIDGMNRKGVRLSDLRRSAPDDAGGVGDASDA
jgi:S-DNA-T family DNA segregation ATPase FtsK/SpoIIIE